MQRIDVSSNTISLPAPQALGTPGYFKAPGVPDQTVVTNDWLNLVQEALCRSILGCNIPLDKTNFSLFSQAIQSGLLNYGETTNVENAYSVTLPVSPILDGSDLYPGSIFRIKFNADNTWASVLSVNGSPEYFIKSLSGSNMFPGEIVANRTLTLMFDGTNFVVQDPLINAYAVSVYLGTTQEIPTGTEAKILFDSTEFDPHIMWDNTAKVITVRPAGIYSVSVRMFTGPGTSGNNAYITLYKNGVALKRMDEKTWNGDNLVLNGTTKIQLAANDYLELYFGSEAGTVDIGGDGNFYNDFQVAFLGYA